MSKEEEYSSVVGCNVALDDQSPPLVLKKKMKTLTMFSSNASLTTMLSTLHWMTKARVWRKVKAKVSNGSQRKQSVRRLARRLAPRETCPATTMTLWEFYYPMRLDMMRRTSPNDDFGESWPLLDSASWEPRSRGYSNTECLPYQRVVFMF